MTNTHKDPEIQELFDSFHPALDPLFTQRLSSSLEAVGQVRDANLAHLRRIRLRAVIAAVAGFIAGLLSATAVPVLAAFLRSLALKAILLLEQLPVHLSLPPQHALPQPFALPQSFALPQPFAMILAWVLVSLTAIVAAAITYDITGPLLAPSGKK